MTNVRVLSTGRRRIVTWLFLQVAVPGLLMAQSSEGSMFRADLLRDGNYQTEGPTHASSKWKFKTVEFPPFSGRRVKSVPASCCCRLDEPAFELLGRHESCR